MTTAKDDVAKHANGGSATAPVHEETKKGFGSGKGMAFLSRIAKALMVPIAILPFAALLNRVGTLFQTGFDPFNPVETYSWVWWIGRIMAIPGAVIFDNLSLFFAIGIGFGLSEDFRGEAAMAATVAFLGLVAITGPDGLAQLFYSKTITYDHGTVKDLVQPVIDSVARGYGPDATINGIAITDIDGITNSIFANFDGKSQLLFFVNSWDVHPEAEGSTNLIVAPSVGYMLDVGVFGGIVAGGTTAFLYNRYKNIKVPDALSFFGGRRFIPMMAMISVWVLGFGFAVIWPWCQLALIWLGTTIAGAGSEAGRVVGFGVYAFFNRLVQPLGLHHIINTFLWFQLPISGPVINGIDVVDGVVITTDTIVSGDITAFQAGVLGSGIFQAGFFPLYMGGYIGIAAALTLAAPVENRKEVGIFFASTAFVAFLTGIDEPILFAFIFVAPVLFIVNCLLVPVFGMIITAQHISLGFGFSAGLIDYIISLPLGWQMAGFQFADGVWQTANTGYEIMANPLWVLVWAAVMGLVYFPIFYFITVKMDIPTEGREKDADGNIITSGRKSTARGSEKYEVLSQAVIDHVGIDNIEEVTNCTTRLRLTVKDNKKGVDDAALKSAGFNGVVRVGSKALQLIVGTDVEHVTEALLTKMAEEKAKDKK